MSKFLSLRKGEIREIDDTLAEKLIADGVVEQYNLIEPTGKITITENGSDIDVAQYAKADVNVSGDYTTAEVTFTIDGSGAVGTAVPWVFDESPDAGIASIVNVSSPSEPQTVNVVLYKGICYATMLSQAQAINTTGSIEYSDGVLVITGPGTVTYTV